MDSRVLYSVKRNLLNLNMPFIKHQQGVVLTADFLTETYFDINKKYYGEAMVYDAEIGYEWSRFRIFI